MDNKVFRVNGDSLRELTKAMQLLGDDYTKAIGYLDDKDNGLVFFRYDSDLMVPFPSEQSMEDCAIIANNWLDKKAVYPPEPNHDGDNEKGWLLYCDDWGHIADYGYHAFMAVKPIWCMYGK